MGIYWYDCIVTYCDLIDGQRGASTGEASKRMRQFHRLVVQQLEDGSLPSIVHTYAWNDSALVVSKVDKSASSFGRALIDLHGFKKALDALGPSFAIAVKGRTFPSAQPSASQRATVLKASSWAMANCFEIEKTLKQRKASWYIDAWIVRRVRGLGTASRIETVRMLPKNRKRSVFLYKNNQLFDEV